MTTIAEWKRAVAEFEAGRKAGAVILAASNTQVMGAMNPGARKALADARSARPWSEIMNAMRQRHRVQMLTEPTDQQRRDKVRRLCGNVRS